MKRLATIVQHRSLTLAVVALLFGLVALGRVFDFAALAHQQGREFVQASLMACIVAFIVCTATLVNLVVSTAPGRRNR